MDQVKRLKLAQTLAILMRAAGALSVGGIRCLSDTILVFMEYVYALDTSYRRYTIGIPSACLKKADIRPYTYHKMDGKIIVVI